MNPIYIRYHHGKIGYSEVKDISTRLKSDQKKYSVVADYDKKGKLLGIEVLGAIEITRNGKEI